MKRDLLLGVCASVGECSLGRRLSRVFFFLEDLSSRARGAGSGGMYTPANPPSVFTAPREQTLIQANKSRIRDQGVRLLDKLVFGHR